MSMDDQIDLDLTNITQFALNLLKYSTSYT